MLRQARCFAYRVFGAIAQSYPEFADGSARRARNPYRSYQDNQPVPLPHLVRACGLRVELVSRLDHDTGKVRFRHLQLLPV